MWVELEKCFRLFIIKYQFILELFDNYMQQDAHEFLNYLLNTIAEILQGLLCFCLVYKLRLVI